MDKLKSNFLKIFLILGLIVIPVYFSYLNSEKESSSQTEKLKGIPFEESLAQKTKNPNALPLSEEVIIKMIKKKYLTCKNSPFCEGLRCEGCCETDFLEITEKKNYDGKWLITVHGEGRCAFNTIFGKVQNQFFSSSLLFVLSKEHTDWIIEKL